MPKVWRMSAIVLIAFVFATNIYRAAMQSLTIDEAFTYNLYLSKNLHAILTQFDANNHVLFTLLAKLCVSLLGKAEWAIRLPSILGGLLYLVAVYKLCRLLLGEGWLFLLGVAALSLNPYLLDFLSAARGYGLSIALLFLAIYSLLRYFDTGRNKFLHRAGVSLGLAVAANLNIVFPAGALMFAALYLGRGARFSTLIDHFCLYALIPAFLILIVPLSYAKREHFYAGNDSINATVTSLLAMSFWHPSATSELDHYVPERAAIWIAFLFAIVTAALWTGSLQARFLALAFALNIALFFAGHLAAHLKYPELRTGLYLIPFFTLLLLAAIKRLEKTRWLQLCCAAPLVLVVAAYAGQWNVSVYGEWPFDASARQVAKLMRDKQPRHIHASWEIVDSLNYYRDRYRLGEIPPIERTKPDPSCDFYILLPLEYSLIASNQLQTIFRDNRSAVVVAVPTSRAP